MAQNDSLNYSSKDKKIRICEKGMVLGMGYGQDAFQIPEGNYRPLFLISRWGIDFRNKNKSFTRPSRFSIFFEPQFNLVLITSDLKRKYEYEFGLNLGIQHLYPLNKRLYLQILISTGPHYFSADTQRQAPGFIFSDNLGMGFYYNLKNHWFVNFGFRLRHMSNAQIRLPNSGINTYNFMIGISKYLKDK